MVFLCIIFCVLGIEFFFVSCLGFVGVLFFVLCSFPSFIYILSCVFCFGFVGWFVILNLVSSQVVPANQRGVHRKGRGEKPNPRHTGKSQDNSQNISKKRTENWSTPRVHAKDLKTKACETHKIGDS